MAGFSATASSSLVCMMGAAVRAAAGARTGATGTKDSDDKDSDSIMGRD